MSILKRFILSVIFSCHVSSIVLAGAINLNTVDIKGLMQLKGVGHHKAETILLYRKQHGKFTNISQLKRVDGIGEQILKLNKNVLTIK